MQFRKFLFPVALTVVGLVFAWLKPAPRYDPAIALPPPSSAVVAGEDQTTIKVWAYFEDRELTVAARTEALAAAKAQLHPRAARRRAKMNAGQEWVDGRDLPLSDSVLRACAATGARLHQQSRWLNAASFQATLEQVARLERTPGVRRVTRVCGLRRAHVPTPIPAASRPLRGPDAGGAKTTTLDYGSNQGAMVQANVVPSHDMGLSGEGVLVAMLDTGFRTTHEALSGIPVLAAWDFVNNDADVDQEDIDPTGSINHGSMTLSTLAGYMPGQLIAPAYGASVLLARTEDLGQEIPIEEDNWVAGLEWAEALGADIISSSLGYIDWYTAADLDGDTAVTSIAADLAVARGLVVVTSAGNDRATSGLLIAPGDADSVVTVGAVDAGGATAWFSSPGPTADGRIKPDVAALGVGNTVAHPTETNQYLTANGTSFSCPLTSGVVALMLERVPTLTPLQVREALRSTASQSASPDNDQGWGIIDASAAVTWFGPVMTHTPLTETDDTVGPYPVTATITDRLGLDEGSLQLRYRINGGSWQSVPLTATGLPDQYQADIPGQPLLTVVDYVVTAASTNGVQSSYPYAGLDEPLTFFVVRASDVAADGVPEPALLGANVPNPFNPRTEIGFTLPAAETIALRIYDLRGRLVRTLLDGPQPAGRQTVVWDGRDRHGRAVGSGTYFYRLIGGGHVQQRKMQLVR